MSYRRVSVNTSLRNAKIFEEDSWDSVDFCLNPKIKLEVEDEDSVDKVADTKIKIETVDNNLIESDKDLVLSETENYLNKSIKKEFVELSDDNAVSSPIKQERLDFETKLKFDTDDTNDSSDNKLNLKSEKFTTKQRNSPYARGEDFQKHKRSLLSISPIESAKRYKTDVKDRCGTDSDRTSGRERDPEVLKRRQKQIDFGKNTVGYDNYIQKVARSERGPTDPMTPNKNKKYSRRGWDGLIKQWRLRIHKYDPAENGEDINNIL